VGEKKNTTGRIRPRGSAWGLRGNVEAEDKSEAIRRSQITGKKLFKEGDMTVKETEESGSSKKKGEGVPPPTVPNEAGRTRTWGTDGENVPQKIREVHRKENPVLGGGEDEHSPA